MKTELQNRLTQFAKDIVAITQEMTLSTINRNTVGKCIEAGTNAGAEYTQANSATTKKSFSFRINMCKSQLQTAQYRLELLVDTTKDKNNELKKLCDEAKELSTIFSKISRKLKKNDLEKAETTETEELEKVEK
ncbi:four helix bundle protein [Patescibacteria group bacterium]|nr:four helix bundle protein [Patescibacteria group bacterium]MBU1757972.1 four helix bundle protein [Patescibacteria group bacterium]